MTDEKSPADRALELFVFAPLGFALSARDLLPQLVERGRQQVTGQVNMARMVGQLAVKQGTVEAEKAFERARTSAQATLEQLGVLNDAPSRPATTRAPQPEQAPPSPVTRDAPPAPATASAGAPTTAEAPPGPAPAPESGEGSRPGAAPGGGTELAIPDYDSLSASQVLPRLSALTPSELEAVGAHESTHRGRKTILSKVAQLQAS